LEALGLLMFLIPQQNLDDTKPSVHVHRRFAPACSDACILSSIKEFAVERYNNSEILHAQLGERHLRPWVVNIHNMPFNKSSAARKAAAMKALPIYPGTKAVTGYLNLDGLASGRSAK
jgi:hypothetical protein